MSNFTPLCFSTSFTLPFIALRNISAHLVWLLSFLIIKNCIFLVTDVGRLRTNHAQWTEKGGVKSGRANTSVTSHRSRTSIPKSTKTDRSDCVIKSRELYNVHIPCHTPLLWLSQNVRMLMEQNWTESGGYWAEFKHVVRFLKPLVVCTQTDGGFSNG